LSLTDKQQLKRDANRQGETENLHEKSVVSQRIIYDYTARVGLVASKRRRLQQQEAQLMLTTGSTRLAVSRGQQT